MKKTTITKSEKLQAVYSEKNIKDDEVLYLTIRRVFFDRILNGTKKVEFRDLTDHYAHKVANFKANEFIDNKPLRYILLQAGYSENSPRLLVELPTIGYRAAGEIKVQSRDFNNEDILKIKQNIEIAAENEGFDKKAEFFAFVLGDVIYSETFK